MENSNKLCPCGSKQVFQSCCNQYLNDKATPPTPEALMRSRYTAYTLSNIEYIKSTMQGKPLSGFNETEAERWSKSVLWLGLKVLNSSQKENQTGYVEFTAKFLDKEVIKTIHETSEFQCINGKWFYIDGKQVNEPTQKVSRNTICPCGSKKKFKNCHGIGRGVL